MVPTNLDHATSRTAPELVTQQLPPPPQYIETATVPANMVWCTYCGQEFSRSEHLDRHVLTHTNVKPFKCSTCHFSFKRRDLLQRHQILVHKYLDEYSAASGPFNMQRRLIACVACARAKTKCDKMIPSCSRCISKGLVCQGRTTRRTNEMAYRHAKRSMSFYRGKPDSEQSTSTEESPLQPDHAPKRTAPVPIRPHPIASLNQHVTSEPRTPEYPSGLLQELRQGPENVSSPSLSPPSLHSMISTTSHAASLYGPGSSELLYLQSSPSVDAISDSEDMSAWQIPWAEIPALLPVSHPGDGTFLLHPQHCVLPPEQFGLFGPPLIEQGPPFMLHHAGQSHMANELLIKPFAMADSVTAGTGTDAGTNWTMR